MSIEALIIYIITGVLLLVSFIADKQKTWKGIIKGTRSFFKLLPILIPMFLFIGVLLAMITPSFISQLLGEQSGLLGMITGLIIGSITFMPPFVAYPLGVDLLENGAALPQVAGFLATLMSVGIVYFSVERKLFSTKSAILRNAVSFIGAILIIIVVLVVY